MRLVTVPHSGTTFTRELLSSWGCTFDTEHAWNAGWREGRIVCTSRDPVLVEISALNRHRWVDFNLWPKIGAWRGMDNVHFFRVDCPPQERDSEIRALAEFCGVDVPEDVDWTPKSTSHDRLGLKERYRRGEVPEELEKVWRFLRSSEETQRLFRSLGYDLLWMR